MSAYIANETAIKRFLGRFLKNVQDIDDTAQEVFMRAFVADAIEPVVTPRPYLFRVAKNLALNHLAKLSNLLTDRIEDVSDTSALPTDHQVSIEDEVDAGQRFGNVVRAIGALPPRCAKVFVLRKIHGFSQKEIALQLCISESTVEKHIALGLVRCGEYLRQQGGALNWE
ncbi:MAG TPA: RNA polymerase sigma factor [Rhizomicrobium sp.]|nr:RNA polymerase sigma factor [Rhizomicrobium sp.]